MCVASLENNVVCPTYVGMNRLNPALLSQVYRMPHVCGDEPDRAEERAETLRMPHVCGDEPF